MTRKFFLASAVAACALIGGSLAVTGDAFAKDGKNDSGNSSNSSTSHVMKVGSDSRHDRDVHRDSDNKNFHRDSDHKDVYRDSDHKDYDYSFARRRERDHDHSRHYWHGTWWDYGTGPCWRWSNDYDEYVWVCD